MEAIKASLTQSGNIEDPSNSQLLLNDANVYQCTSVSNPSEASSTMSHSEDQIQVSNDSDINNPVSITVEKDFRADQSSSSSEVEDNKSRTELMDLAAVETEKVACDDDLRDSDNCSIQKQKEYDKETIDDYGDDDIGVDEEDDSERRFDPRYVNRDLESISQLKLGKYHGIIKQGDNLAQVLDQVVKACGVAHELKFEKLLIDGKPAWKEELFINNVFVSQCNHRNVKTAKNVCKKRGLRFLMNKGLKLRYESDIAAEQITVVRKEDLSSCTIKQHFTSFLENKDKVKMIFEFTPDRAEKDLIELLCEKSQLTFRPSECGASLIAMKKNSTFHKMELLPKRVLTSPSVPNHKTLTKEDLVAFPSIKNHIEKFVGDGQLYKLIFPGNLEDCQKELIQLLVEKHGLNFEITDESIKTVIWKDPDRKKKKKKGNQKKDRSRANTHEKTANKKLWSESVKQRHRSGEPSGVGGSVKRNKTSCNGRGGTDIGKANPRRAHVPCQIIDGLNRNQRKKRKRREKLNNMLNEMQESHNVSFFSRPYMNNTGASGYVPFDRFASSSPSMGHNSNLRNIPSDWNSYPNQESWNSQHETSNNYRRGGRFNMRR